MGLGLASLSMSVGLGHRATLSRLASDPQVTRSGAQSVRATRLEEMTLTDGFVPENHPQKVDSWGAD